MIDDVVYLFGVDQTPSDELRNIMQKTSATIITYPTTFHEYSPSIQFQLYSKYFSDHTIESPYMLCDSDVIFLSSPRLHRSIEGNVCCVSDCRSYIGYDYLISKGEQQLADMTRIVGITPDIVKQMDSGAGGAQILLKKQYSSSFWDKVEQDSIDLYVYMKARESQWDGEGYPIQKWTAGMWSVLWNLWLEGTTTSIREELSFVWASDSIKPYTKSFILHAAGVTARSASTYFYKGLYTTESPFGNSKLDRHLVDTPLNYSQVYAREVHDAGVYWSTL